MAIPHAVGHWSEYQSADDYLSLLKELRPVLADFIIRVENRQMAPEDKAVLLRSVHQLSVYGAGHGYPQVDEASCRLEEALVSHAAENTLLHCVHALHGICHEALTCLPSSVPFDPADAVEVVRLMGRPPVILAADDDRTVLGILESLFAPYARLLTVADGCAARSALERYLPDLLILDDTMPGITGLRLLGQIRQEYKLRDSSVMMLTSSDRPQDLMRAYDAGVLDYILKPFDPQLLARKVWAILRQQAQHRQAPPDCPS